MGKVLSDISLMSPRLTHPVTSTHQLAPVTIRKMSLPSGVCTLMFTFIENSTYEVASMDKNDPSQTQMESH